MPRLHPHSDRARRRLPQRFRACMAGGCGIGPCPLRPYKLICDGEGPHAQEWLYVRGSTVFLRVEPHVTGGAVMCEQLAWRWSA